MPKTTKRPALRFAGFSDEWEERKLGDIGSTYTGLSGKTSSDFGHGEAKYITYMNVFSNPITSPKMVEAVEIDDKQHTVQKGDVFFTTSSETPEEVGMSSVLQENSAKTYLNSFCFGYRPAVKFDNNFLAYTLRSPKIRKKIVFLAQGISRYNISKNKVMEIKIPIPYLNEQWKIGEHFAILNRLIALHERKYSKLMNVKKFMLEKMFPKDGAKVPALRFAGFSGEWEERKLGDIGKARSGVGFPDVEQGGTEGIPFYKVSDMNLVGNEIEMTRSNNYVTNEQIEKKRWNPVDDVPAIFFAKVGAAVMLNRKRLCRFPFLLDNNTMAYSLYNDYWNMEFAKAAFTKIDFTKLIQVGALPSYNSGDVEDIRVMLPPMKEQNKIGQYFAHLDHLLSLHRQELERLQNVKKSCLEKMFA